jgi:hypothetical protein
MFNGPDFPASLDESLFENWLEEGRNSKIAYAYLLLIWDELESQYIPKYAEKRSEIGGLPKYGSSPEHQSLVAAYDLYSEGRVA